MPHQTKWTHPQPAVRPKPYGQDETLTLGLLRLQKQYGTARLEAAIARALALGNSRYRAVQAILKHGQEQGPIDASHDDG